MRNEWFMVKYNQKFTKEIQRNSSDLKAIPSDSAYSLRTGSKCLILSDYAYLWYVGQIMDVFVDDGEEWLAVKYNENDLEKIAEIQRNSPDLKVFTDANYRELIMPEYIQEQQQQQQHNNEEEKDEKEQIALNSMSARIKALAKNRDVQRNNEIMDLLRIFSNILKSPFDSKFHCILFDEVKHKWMANPICVELLYDAGFKKTTDGKKLQFNFGSMKALKETDEALKKQFYDLAEALTAEEEEAKICNAEEYSVSCAHSDHLEPLYDGSFPEFDDGQDIVETNQSGGLQLKKSLFVDHE